MSLLPRAGTILLETILNVRQILPTTRGKGKRFTHCAEYEKGDDVSNQEALFTSVVANKSCWIIDSCATKHMTLERNRLKLTDYVGFM